MDPTLIPRPRHMIEPQFQKATADVREAQAIEILNDWGLHITHETIYIYTHIYIYTYLQRNHAKLEIGV